MANKGQKFQHYPESVKREAIRLHLEEKRTYRKITEQLWNKVWAIGGVNKKFTKLLRF